MTAHEWFVHPHLCCGCVTTACQCDCCCWPNPSDDETATEEPCRCIAAGRGGVHYPSDHARATPPKGGASCP